MKLTLPAVKQCGGYRDGQRCRSNLAPNIPVDLCADHADELRALWKLDLTTRQRKEHEEEFGPRIMARIDEQQGKPRDPSRARRKALGLTQALGDHSPVVYYLKFGDRIKIGTTQNLPQRLNSLPHDELLATEFGDVALERQRHHEFEHLRIKGEWYRPGKGLLAHIEAVRRAGHTVSK